MSFARKSLMVLACVTASAAFGQTVVFYDNSASASSGSVTVSGSGTSGSASHPISVSFTNSGTSTAFLSNLVMKLHITGAATTGTFTVNLLGGTTTAPGAVLA